MTIRSRYVIAMQANVEGEWTSSMKIASVSLVERPAGAIIGITMQNDGGTFVKPSGTIIIKDAANKELFSHSFVMGNLVPSTEVTYPVQWQGTLKAGTYGVDVYLAYGDNQTTDYSDTFVVSPKAQQEAVSQARALEPPTPSVIQPWMVAALAVLLVGIIILLVLNLLRNRQRTST